MSHEAPLPETAKSAETHINPTYSHQNGTPKTTGSAQESGNSSLPASFADTQTVVVSPSVGSNLGEPAALAIGAFATTLTTLSLSLMEWRGVTTTNVYIGNFFFVAGIGMVISAQWELVKGNSFGYTVFSAFGFFYAGFGSIITPLFGVRASYTPANPAAPSTEYYNALGFFVIMWTVFNTFFLLASLASNLVYIGIFFFVELAFLFVSASYFALADGHAGAAEGLKKAGGVFAFLAGLLGWYALGYLMCREVAGGFQFPLGNVREGLFAGRKRGDEESATALPAKRNGTEELKGA